MSRETLPGWIMEIQNETLRTEFRNVWRRLPGHVKPALAIDWPAVRVVDKQDTAAKTRVAVDRATGATSMIMLFRADLLQDPPAVIRALISHELAHVYLRHLDHLLAKREKPPEVADWHEWHANFAARHLFGMNDDFEAKNEYLREHPELDEVNNGIR